MVRTFIPGPGFSVGGINTTAVSAYLHLGPIVSGTLLDRLDVSLVTSGVTILHFSPVLIQSPGENVSTFQSGSAVILPGGATRDGKPAFAITTNGPTVWRFVVPLGLLIRDGPMFLLCAMSSSGGGIIARWNLSLFTLRRGVEKAVEAVE